MERGVFMPYPFQLPNILFRKSTHSVCVCVCVGVCVCVVCWSRPQQLAATMCQFHANGLMGSIEDRLIYTRAHTHTHTHALTSTHAQTHTHAHAHAHTHAHKHAPTNTH